MSWPQNVRKSDLDIQWFNGSGAGGQHRNKHANCCRMTHKPTGVRTQSAEHKSREQNQRAAFRRLAKLLVPRMLTPNEHKRATVRVRTYHEPRGTVTDHRAPGVKFEYRQTLDGDLAPIHKEIMMQIT